MTTSAAKDTKDAKDTKEPTLEERVAAIEKAIGLGPVEEAPVVAPAAPPAPHELYVPGDEE